MTEKFTLQWNDFQTNAVQNYSKLRNSSEFMDVTLVGDDHKLVSAHKVILTSCSEYFRSILTKHEHSHPLICLDGVESQDIENALDFIYNGALHIFHDDLDRFLQLAQKLKLEGLIGNPEKLESPIWKNDTSLIEEEKLNENTMMGQSNLKIKENFSMISDGIPNIEELDLKLRENVQKIDGGNKCIICGKVFKNPGHAREHVEMAHIEGLQFNCSFCDKTYRNRNALRRHKNQYAHI